MSNFAPQAHLHSGSRFSGKKRKLAAGLFVIILLGIGIGVAFAYKQYENNLLPVSDSLQQQFFTVEKGATTQRVSESLQQAGLIRSAKALEFYMRQTGGVFQAGTYVLTPSLSAKEVASKLNKGDVAKNLFTILPGKRLDQIKQAFLDAGYTQTEVDAAFSVGQYRNHPALAGLPAGATLEGYLYPDSYEKQKDAPPDSIIRAALDEMAKKLSQQLRADIQNQGLTIHQAVILASIVTKEVSDPNQKPTVAQVFIKRYRENIMLGSDVTAFYASALAGQEPSVFIDSPYNTRKYGGLPPGPISNLTVLDLDAIAHPAATDFLFFVAGDDGTIHYSRTQAEHEALTEKYCKKLCN